MQVRTTTLTESYSNFGLGAHRPAWPRNRSHSPTAHSRAAPAAAPGSALAPGAGHALPVKPPAAQAPAVQPDPDAADRDPEPEQRDRQRPQSGDDTGHHARGPAGRCTDLVPGPVDPDRHVRAGPGARWHRHPPGPDRAARVGPDRVDLGADRDRGG